MSDSSSQDDQPYLEVRRDGCVIIVYGDNKSIESSNPSYITRIKLTPQQALLRLDILNDLYRTGQLSQPES